MAPADHHARSSRRGFNLFELLIIGLILGAAVFTGWYVWESGRIADELYGQAAKTATAADAAAATQTQNDGWNTTVTSGKGGFRITFPDGWTGIRRDTASDAFMIGGEAQPEIALGHRPIITSSAFGSDGPTVLYVGIVSGPFEAPQGTAADVTLENGKTDPIAGKKYVYEYPSDEVVGLGTQRVKGDRDYTYVFRLGSNRRLEVHYSVYASDPRNNSTVIDELVRTIRLN
ncbi:MAG TPA: hypothetical protein VHC98_00110 [Candidatus Saccharimonadales bacterium]|nr:hypothetical protein [Candidatus Saccharimonadales bacterium]